MVPNAKTHTCGCGVGIINGWPLIANACAECCWQLRVARAFRNVLEDIDERRSIQSFASARSSRSSRSRRAQWGHRAATSIDSTTSESYATSAARRVLSTDPDGSYLNMALAESRRASTKSRSYENVGSNADAVAAATVPTTRFTKQSSLPVNKPMLCPGYMSTNDSDVDLRRYKIPLV